MGNAGYDSQAASNVIGMLLAAATQWTLGPVRRLSYADARVRATIAYRAARDAAGRSRAASGTLAIDTSGRRYSYELATVLPIPAHAIAFPTSWRNGCGAMQALGREGHYLVIEAVWAEKGCRAAATFVDLDTGRFAQTVDIDHRYSHRLDVIPQRFTGEPIRVVRVESVRLRAPKWSASGLSLAGTIPWDFVLIHGVNARGAHELFAFEVARFHLNGKPDPGWVVRPTVGSTVTVGMPAPYPFDYHPDALVLRLSPADDTRYASLQVPPSRRSARLWQRNQWFAIADLDVERGRFQAGVDAFAQMLRYEDDASLDASERAMLTRCRAMLLRVRSGRASRASYAIAWQRSCSSTSPP